MTQPGKNEGFRLVNEFVCRAIPDTTVPRAGVAVTISEPRIDALEVTDDAIVAQLADGRIISVPLAWSWRLAQATPAQRSRFELIGSGEGVHWPELDEHISARGMLQGMPACPPKQPKPSSTGPDANVNQ